MSEADEPDHLNVLSAVCLYRHRHFKVP